VRTVLILLALSGCAAQEVVVKVPVAVPCVREVPQRPAMASRDQLLAMDDERLLLIIAAERLEQGAYSAQAEALLSACR
jgi:hypothetical protein